MPTDCRPDYPVKALLIGGPAHGKRLNLEKDQREYVMTESSTSVGAGITLPVPANAGFFESKYVEDQVIGDLTLYVHESVLIPGVHRLPKAAEQARDKIANLHDRVAAAQDDLAAATKQIEALTDDLDYHKREADRHYRMLSAAQAILNELVPA